MARLARIVIPGIPHHVTQRGNRRGKVFFGPDDYRCYLHLLTEAAENSATEVWAYCLMPNHVHLIVVPSYEDGLRAMFSEAHRRYTRRINVRNKWTGHLWQGRFGSVAMDEAHLANAVRYVSLNPVRAKMVRSADDWAWSSARAHLRGRDDELVQVAPVISRYPDFADWLAVGEDEDMSARLRKAETIGRPVGGDHWLRQLDAKIGRALQPARRGPKPTHFVR